MSTLANRLTGAPVDDQLAAYAWALSCSMTHNDGEAQVRLRRLGPGDQDEFLAQARASAKLHHPWYSMPTTREDFDAYLARLSQPATEGFLVCLRDGGALAGMVTIDTPPFPPAEGRGRGGAEWRKRREGRVSRRRRCPGRGLRRCRR
jgi:hypothetical protein